MFKWLLLFAGAGFFYFWLRGKKQAKFDQENADAANRNQAQSLIEPEAMVQCQYCKIHLPQSNAIFQEDRFYCSSEHLSKLDKEGWLGKAIWCGSPNKDDRPEQTEPDLLVIHHISLPPGEFKNRASSQYIIDFFQNKLDPNQHPYFAEIADQKVSSHFLIARTGQIIQFVSTQDRAWHAGVSRFMNREKCNDFAIGVELEGDGETPFEDSQYEALAKLVHQLLERYPSLQFAGHSDIAPNRKTDPGKYFDWEKFQKETGISSEKLPFGLLAR